MPEVDEETYQRLKTRWANLREIIEKSATAPLWAERDEQESWDEWVDWVEGNDLNYTKYDPRGPEGEQVGVMEWVK